MAVSELLSRVKGAANVEENKLTSSDDEGVMEWEEPELANAAKFTWSDPDSIKWVDSPPGDLLQKDPKPNREAEKEIAKEERRAAPTRVLKAQQKEIKDTLVMLISLPAATLLFKDPICANAILDNVDNVAEKLVPIICRNPTMLRWFTEGGGYMDYFALAMACAPIAKTVYTHHVSKSIGHEDELQPDFTDYRAPEFNQGF